MAGIPLDFTGVESGPTRVPEGDYLLKIKMVKPGASSKAKTPMIRVTYVIADGPKKGKEIIDDLYLTEKTLWRVRAWLEALGEDKLGGKFSVLPRKYIGKLIGATIADDTQEGYATRSRPTGYYDASDVEGDDSEDEDDEDETEADGDDGDDGYDDDDTASDEEDEDEDGDEDEDEDSDEDAELEDLSNDELKARAKAAGVKPIPQRLSAKSRPKFIEAIRAAEGDEEDEDEPEEDEDTDDLADLSRQELKALIKDEGLEVKVYKSDSDDDLRTKITEARPEDDDAEDDEDEDEEEEEAEPEPPKRKTKAPADKAKRAAKPAEDDLDDVDLDDL